MRSFFWLIPVAVLAGCEKQPAVVAPAVYDSAPVKAGSLLVEIDKRTPRNSLAQTEAALAAAQARRKIAQTQMERAAALFKTQTLTQADLEQTQLEFANAESQVVSTSVAVENARITLEDTDVRAPITGTII